MDALKKKDGESLSIVDENIGALKIIFPDAFIEDGIDFDALRQLLGDDVADGEEKYGLTWHGKKKARQIALTPSTGTLRPCPEESVDWETTQNLFIEGDNLEVLKLLQKSYAGKVKMIYIDPPYNTGKEFIYPDKFQDNLDTYLRYTGQKSHEGLKTSSNTESSGRYHTNWLSMMYPRLKVASTLLKRDGAIFVSCDENEHTRLRSIMDEIFGEENFIADMVWAAGRKNDSRLISISHEYIVCYAKNSSFLREEKIEWRQRKKGLDDIYSAYSSFKRTHGDDYQAISDELKKWYRELPDSHPAKAHKHYNQADRRGVYFAADISWPGGGGPKYEVIHPISKKPVKVPSRGWTTPDPQKMAEWIKDDRVHFGADETSVPCLKKHLKDGEFQPPYSVFYQDGRAASKRLRALMGGDCFDFPKDEIVLQELIEMLTEGNDLVVDFFAGSATTAHSVLAQNAVDRGTRRFIMVQLPEPLDPANKSQKVGAELCDELGVERTIAKLAQERVRRAAKKIQDEHPEFDGDIGFKVFKLDSSNIQAWNPDNSDLEQTLLDHAEHLLEGRSEQDVLYELLLKRGVDLTVPIEGREIAGKSVYSIGYGVLFACLDESIDKSEIETLGQGITDWHRELKPAADTQVVFRDSAFADDIAKTNMTAILEQNGIAHVRSL
jgi:adenine-specific DNA-methyltransferase